MVENTQLIHPFVQIDRYTSICREKDVQVVVYFCTGELFNHLKKRNNESLTHAMGTSPTTYYGPNSQRQHSVADRTVSLQMTEIDWRRYKVSSREWWDTDSKFGVLELQVGMLSRWVHWTLHLCIFICKIIMHFFWCKFYLSGEKQLEKKQLSVLNRCVFLHNYSW